MVYKKFTIDTTLEAIDFISAALSEVGVEGIEVEDGIPLTEEEQSAMFIGMMPDEEKPFDGVKVSFYLDAAMPDGEMKKVLCDIRRQLLEVAQYVDAGTLDITTSETADEDWLNSWKEFFHPFSVGDVLIRPSWEEADMGDHKMMIAIDPGTTFGTGSHETTKLAINALRKYIKSGDRVLDVGIGSGILSIVAIKSGAEEALGTDIDPAAVDAPIDNATANGISQDEIKVVFGDIIEDNAVKEQVGCGYDVAVANILAPVIIALRDVIINHINDGGIFIVSGIIDFKEAEVKEAFALNPMWEYIETTHDGEWVSIVYRKRTT